MTDRLVAQGLGHAVVNKAGDERSEQRDRRQPRRDRGKPRDHHPTGAMTPLRLVAGPTRRRVEL